MKKKISQQALFQLLEGVATDIPDLRDHKRTTHRIRDAIFSAFSCFFLQAVSFRSHFESLYKGQGTKNRRSLFGLYSVPTEQHTRNLLDEVNPKYFTEVMDRGLRAMDRSLVLKDFKHGELFGYTIAIDGLEWLRSEKVRCDACLHCTHSDGRIENYHRAVVAGIVHPTENLILPLAPEFVSNTDGTSKQDCETKAGKRWIESWIKRHHKMKVTFLADDLYCTQPMLEIFLESKCNFIVSCKEGSHGYLYEWVAQLDQDDLKTVTRKAREGNKSLVLHYEYANNVPLKDGDSALSVNFVRLTITDARTGRIISTFAFVTNVEVTASNCIQIVKLGRNRWKIENENNNRLKTLDYHLEHNYGHGHQYLVFNLFTLNLIAMLFHVILEYVKQEGFAVVRAYWNTLRTAIGQIRHAFVSFGSKEWDALYRYACFGIDSS